MDQLHQQIILLLSIPIYAILIPLEVVLSHMHGWKRYSLKETLMNVYLNGLNAGLDLLLRGLALGVLLFFFNYHLPIEWHPVVYWVALFLLEDLLFWLEHFVDHRVRLFWAVHVTHHSSEEYNLSTGFRSSVLMPCYRYLYFIPLALLGFEPIDILFMYALTQTYGILVHTQSIGRLPRWVEFIFVTPSHHRVHHASNIPYLDKNMGMVLIIWDRLFGTFMRELPQEPPRYGLTSPLAQPLHPAHIVFHEWKVIGKDLKRPLPWRVRLKYLFGPPGWSHDGSSQTSKDLQEQWAWEQQVHALLQEPAPAKRPVRKERVEV
jgi:sterol desaturase/sphingolipid hydroxylase (fatty acid hydroxylase superfamily)